MSARQEVVSALQLRPKLRAKPGRGGVRLSGDEALVLDDALAFAEELIVERFHLRSAVRREHDKVRVLEEQLEDARKQVVRARGRAA